MNQGSKLDAAKDAIITVGDGRGFIVGQPGHEIVVTAAHCLPHFPPAHAGSYLEERTYADLLGPLGGGNPKVWAECLFADPIGDIAVLGSPDGQELWDEADAYNNLVEAALALPIIEAPTKCDAWLFGLDGRWDQCTVTHSGGPLLIKDARGGIHAGMSGSPILVEDGSAIGIVCLSGGAPGEIHTNGGPNPRLMGNLPGWLLWTL